MNARPLFPSLSVVLLFRAFLSHQHHKNINSHLHLRFRLHLRLLRVRIFPSHSPRLLVGLRGTAGAEGVLEGLDFLFFEFMKDRSEDAPSGL